MALVYGKLYTLPDFPENKFKTAYQTKPQKYETYDSDSGDRLRGFLPSGTGASWYL